MKRILISIFIVLLFVCCTKRENSKQPNSTHFDSLTIENETFYFDSITRFEYEKLKYDGLKNIDTLIIDTTRIKIKKDTISIFPLNGKTVTFINDTVESEDMVKYKYLKTIKSCNSILIVASYWESYSYYLVNILNGQNTKLWDLPNFSPNNKFIISSSAYLDYADMPNGFQLFKVETDGIKLIFDKGLDDWEANEIKWKSDSTIYIKRAKLDKGGDRIYDYLTTRIIK